MALKTKVILILCGIFALYGAVNFGIHRFIIFPSYLEMEKHDAGENIQRAISAIDREIAHIDSLCHDWSAWDDTYDFIQTVSEEYIDSNLPFSTFADNELNMIYLVDNTGSVVWGEIYDLETEERISLDVFPGESLPATHPLLSYETEGADLSETFIKGIIKTSAGPLLVSSRPILTSGNNGPPRGHFIMGRLFNEEMIDSLTDQIRVDFTIYPAINSIEEHLGKTPLQVHNGPKYYLNESTDSLLLHIHTIYPDISGNAAFAIRMIIPREIVQQGLATMRFALLSILAAGLCVLVVMLFLLQKTILHPITRLIRHMLNISETGNFSRRLSIRRNDEIGTLGREFDKMVEMIEEQTNVMELINNELIKDVSKRIEIEKALQEANQQLENLAMLDGLTQIANRRRFDECLDLEWRRMMRQQKPLSLILCDVDFFKLYNDRYGHLTGDDCLCAIARVINNNAKRAEDFAARYGGEEFVIILPDTDITGARHLAESIRKDIEALKIPHESSSCHKYVTLSLGISCLIPSKELSPEILIELADKALYEAKAGGRNNSVVKTEYTCSVA